jgi:hypothetical protein
MCFSLQLQVKSKKVEVYAYHSYSGNLQILYPEAFHGFSHSFQAHANKVPLTTVSSIATGRNANFDSGSAMSLQP